MATEFLQGMQLGSTMAVRAQDMRANALNMSQRLMQMQQQEQVFPLELQQLQNKQTLDSMNIQTTAAAINAQHADDVAWTLWHKDHTNAIDILTNPPVAGTLDGMKRVATAQKVVGDTIAGMELIATQQAKNPLIKAQIDRYKAAEAASRAAEQLHVRQQEALKTGGTLPKITEVPDPRNPGRSLLMSPHGAVIDTTKFLSLEQRDELKLINSQISVYQKQIADQEAIGSEAAKQKVKDLSQKVADLEKKRKPIYESGYHLAKASGGIDESEGLAPTATPPVTPTPQSRPATQARPGYTVDAKSGVQTKKIGGKWYVLMRRDEDGREGDVPLDSMAQAIDEGYSVVQ